MEVKCWKLTKVERKFQVPDFDRKPDYIETVNGYDGKFDATERFANRFDNSSLHYFRSSDGSWWDWTAYRNKHQPGGWTYGEDRIPNAAVFSRMNQLRQHLHVNAKEVEEVDDEEVDEDDYKPPFRLYWLTEHDWFVEDTDELPESTELEEWVRKVQCWLNVGVSTDLVQDPIEALVEDVSTGDITRVRLNRHFPNTEKFIRITWDNGRYEVPTCLRPLSQSGGLEPRQLATAVAEEYNSHPGLEGLRQVTVEIPGQETWRGFVVEESGRFVLKEAEGNKSADDEEVGGSSESVSMHWYLFDMVLGREVTHHWRGTRAGAFRNAIFVAKRSGGAAGLVLYCDSTYTTFSVYGDGRVTELEGELLFVKDNYGNVIEGTLGWAKKPVEVGQVEVVSKPAKEEKQEKVDMSKVITNTVSTLSQSAREGAKDGLSRAAVDAAVKQVEALTGFDKLKGLRESGKVGEVSAELIPLVVLNVGAAVLPNLPGRGTVQEATDRAVRAVISANTTELIGQLTPILTALTQALRSGDSEN